MELERKIELMEKYQLDGYRTNLATMQFRLDNIIRGLSAEETNDTINGLYQDYEFVSKHYSAIDFAGLKKEMGEDDRNDFETLFRVRDMLPRLKQTIDELAIYFEESNHSVSQSLVKKFESLIKELAQADDYNGVRYRTRILRHKEILLKT